MYTSRLSDDIMYLPIEIRVKVTPEHCNTESLYDRGIDVSVEEENKIWYNPLTTVYAYILVVKRLAKTYTVFTIQIFHFTTVQPSINNGQLRDSINKHSLK